VISPHNFPSWNWRWKCSPEPQTSIRKDEWIGCLEGNGFHLENEYGWELDGWITLWIWMGIRLCKNGQKWRGNKMGNKSFETVSLTKKFIFIIHLLSVFKHHFQTYFYVTHPTPVHLGSISRRFPYPTIAWICCKIACYLRIATVEKAFNPWHYVLGQINYVLSVIFSIYFSV
jgi:hypothetical protein